MVADAASQRDRATVAVSMDACLICATCVRWPLTQEEMLAENSRPHHDELMKNTSDVAITICMKAQEAI
jgi:hypothetical protein